MFLLYQNGIVVKMEAFVRLLPYLNSTWTLLRRTLWNLIELRYTYDQHIIGAAMSRDGDSAIFSTLPAR